LKKAKIVRLTTILIVTNNRLFVCWLSLGITFFAINMADIQVILYTAMFLPKREDQDQMNFLEKYVDEEDAQKIYNEIFKKEGGKKKKIRKHKGINQKTGRLNKGYKYSGKKSKSGLKQIVKS